MKNSPNVPGNDAARTSGPLLEILIALCDGGTTVADVLDIMESWPGGRALPLGSFYRHLERGVREGWIEIAEGSPSVGRGRPARQYRLTAEGRRLASSCLARIERLSELARSAGLRPEEVR